MRRVTGTTVYAYTQCPRAAELDLHLDRALRRPPTDAEEFARARGRELEARLTAALGYPVPDYPRRDWRAGAAATEALVRAGADGVCQGVLLAGDLLGIPDLLRRETGRSDLGDFHYVVGDIKSSRRPRAEQVLQVAFYARLLTALQGRPPAYGYLQLKDGSEHRFDLAEVEPVLASVVAEVERIAAGDGRCTRPFLAAGCRRCHWSDRCAAELDARGDLSLLDGMTRGLRTVLEAAGIESWKALRELAVDRIHRRTRLETALLRRLRVAVGARADNRPLPVDDAAPSAAAADWVIVHALADGFGERLLGIGAIWVGADGVPAAAVELPEDEAAEFAAFDRLLARLPRPADELLVYHWGPQLPAWFDGAAWAEGADVGSHGHFVDLARRLRARVVFPGPVFELRDAVRMGLGVDPDRAGDADAAPLWTDTPEGPAWLEHKLRADLADLLALKQRWLDRAGS